tara:strand:+ start:7325 stop:8080 length:756 start_codon:yes stop_codon:yes gene_type:complete
MKLNLPKLIGHRGMKSILPENTIDSIYKAIEFNFKWIEIDVKISKDNIPFLLHDDSLFRTTGCNKNPTELKYNFIQKLNAGKQFNKKLINPYPPTLQEVLLICSKNNIGLNIELKPNKGYEIENVKAIIKVIKKFSFYEKYYFSSFDWISIISIKKNIPNSNAGILIDNYSTEKKFIEILEKCKKYNLFSCGLNINIITSKILLLCKKYNLHISCYSSKNIPISSAKILWKKGVDTIFIDNPRTYKKILVN